MLEQAKNTCEQVFGKRLRELRKENGAVRRYGWYI